MNWKFGLTHWIVTLAMGPIIPTAAAIIKDRENYPLLLFFAGYFVHAFLALLLSLPTLVIYLIILRLLDKSGQTIKKTKARLVITSALGALITVLIIGRHDDNWFIISETIGFTLSATIVGILLKWDTDSPDIN